MGWDIIPVDIYCERTDASFWSEPVNALTNAAFIIAAVAAARRYRAAGVADVPIALLIAVVALIGLGSFAFHTLATREAVLLDVVPITLFIYGYLVLALHRFIGFGIVAALAMLVAFIAVSAGIAVFVPRAWLNGSIDYAPALAALGGVSLWTRDLAVCRRLLLAAAIFTASLAFRTIDDAVCPAFPIGTHFAWHVLNAVVLYILLSTAVDAAQRQHEAAPASPA